METIKTRASLRVMLLFFILVAFFSDCLLAAETNISDPNASSKYLDAVREFADNVLKYGRDTYGSKHTLLFVDGLMVRDPNNPNYGKDGVFKPVEWIAPNGDRWILSNLASQQNLFRTLDGLTVITGDPKYKQAAMDAIKYAFENLRSPNGLLYWGAGTAYDAQKDEVFGNKIGGGYVHCLKQHFPYYELMWEVNSKETKRFIEAFWSAHIWDWSNLQMDRISHFYGELEQAWKHEYKGGPIFLDSGSGYSLINAGTDLAYAAAFLTKRSGDKYPLVWAKRLLRRYVDTRHPKTGISYWMYTKPLYSIFDSYDDVTKKLVPGTTEFLCTTFPGIGAMNRIARECSYGFGESTPGIGVQVAVLYHQAKFLIGEMLDDEGDEFKQWAPEELTAFGKASYREEDNVYVPILTDGTNLEGYLVKEDGPLLGPKGATLEPCPVGPSAFWSYTMGYRVMKDKFMWEMAKSIAMGNDFGDIGATPKDRPQLNLDTSCSNPYAILAFLELYRATEKKGFLEIAKKIGDNVLDKRYYKGFFVASKKHIYTKFDAIYSLALLQLHSTLTGDAAAIPQAWPSSPSFSCPYRSKYLAVDNQLYTLTESTELPISINEAAATGNLDLVKSFIAKGADVNNMEDPTYSTPLERAAMHGHVDVFKLLIAKGADANRRDQVGNTLLHHAVTASNVNIVELLITESADVNAKNKDGHTPLDIAVGAKRKYIVELLIANGADVSLYAAVFVGDLAKVKSLIEEKADINKKDAGGNAPLHYAAEGGYKEVAELLLANGADVNAKNTAGDTPLHLAKRAGHEDVIELLIANGADVNAKNNDGQTPSDIIRINYTRIVFISAVVALLVAGIVFAIPLVFRLRRVAGQPKRFFRYFVLFIGMYFVEFLAVFAGIVLGFTFGFVWALALVSGLTSVWGVILGIWLRGRSTLRDVLKASFLVCLYTSLPMVWFLGILFPVLTIIQGQSIVSVEALRGSPLEALPWPNTVLGVSVALSVGTVLVKTVIIIGIITLLIRSKANGRKRMQ